MYSIHNIHFTYTKVVHMIKVQKFKEEKHEINSGLPY